MWLFDATRLLRREFRSKQWTEDLLDLHSALIYALPWLPIVCVVLYHQLIYVLFALYVPSEFNEGLSEIDRRCRWERIEMQTEKEKTTNLSDRLEEKQWQATDNMKEEQD